MNLSSKKIKRTGKPDYDPISKSDLWLSVQDDSGLEKDYSSIGGISYTELCDKYSQTA